MVFNFFRKDPRRAVIDALYGRVAAASRHPGLFAGVGVSDTLEGRFESLALHVVLAVRRLRRLPSPADAVAQDLIDTFFRELDRAMRELGVGDFGVPKRMKKLAQGFYARAAGYGAALDAGDAAALAGALQAQAIEDARPARALARYALAAEAELASLDLDALLQDGPRFPPPDRFAEEPSP